MSATGQAAKAKQRAAELVDSAFTLINDGNVEAAVSFYLQALEEVGRVMMLKENPGSKIADAPPTSVVSVGGTTRKARDARVEAALRHLQGTNLLTESGTELVVRKDVPGVELKMGIVTLKSKLSFL